MAESTPASALPASLWERRLRAEWALLEALVRRNPGRLTAPSAHDGALCVTLLETPAVPVSPHDESFDGLLLRQHRLRLTYPRFFPATPIETHLDRPVFHPNIHPASGFLCLWDRHRTTNTVEHALHKAAAMLGWRLLNLGALHIMQPRAAALTPAQSQALAERLAAPPLLGVDHGPDTPAIQSAHTIQRRRTRLS